MLILAISDMHNNVTCVRKLRAQESNDYDVIAIPGDIGSHRAAEIFETLRTFECPIVCIRGNWDHMPEDARFGQQVHFAHLKIVKVGKLAFTGYSFSGSLPNSLGTTANDADYGRKCRALLAAAIRDAGVDLRRCVLMAHDRAAHLDREFPNLLLQPRPLPRAATLPPSWVSRLFKDRQAASRSSVQHPKWANARSDACSSSAVAPS
jgi:hypothetical protein